MSGPLGIGTAGGAPRNAQYVTLVANAALTDERALTGTANEIVLTDGGAGNAITLSAGSLIVQTDQANIWTTGPQEIQTGAAETKGLILKLAAGQSANGFEVQDSVGNVISGVDERGVPFCDLNTTGVGITANVFYGPDVGNTTMASANAGNVLIGDGVGVAITTGYRNTGIGGDALVACTQGYNNVAIGYRALVTLTTGYQNFALGTQALEDLLDGYGNVAIGVESLGEATSALGNTGVGAQTLQNVRIGTGNVAIGQAAGRFCNTNSGRNTLVGFQCAYGVNDGGSRFDNSLVGYQTGYKLSQGGFYNTMLGTQAGYNLTTGDGNVFIGYQAAYNEAGSNKLYIANSNTATPLIYGEFDGGGGYGIIIHGPATTAVTFTVKEIASQSADAIQVQTSTGAVLLSVLAAGHLQFGEAVNIVAGTTTGTQIGTAAAQKLGFFGTTPAVQQAHIIDASGTLADITTKFNTLLLELETLGLLAAA